MSIETINAQFQMSSMVMKANVGDVTHEESLIQPQPAGNCLNWILAHQVAIRCHFIEGFGGIPVWSKADIKKYDRHEPPIADPAEAKPLSEIWKALDDTLGAITKIVSELTPQQLKEKAPFSPVNNPDETIGSLLAAFAFHDAYHAGQTGVLRRLIGKPPADL